MIQQIVDSFFSKIKPVGDCWMWTGHTNSRGYGGFWNGESTIKAHRFSWVFLMGPIPKKLVIDHLCRKRSCVNPGHMEIVTNKENILRGVSPSAKHARKTYCYRGHPLSGENLNLCLLRNGTKKRECISCRREYHRVYYLKRKAAEAKGGNYGT